MSTVTIREKDFKLQHVKFSDESATAKVATFKYKGALYAVMDGGLAVMITPKSKLLFSVSVLHMVRIAHKTSHKGNEFLQATFGENNLITEKKLDQLIIRQTTEE